MLSLNLHRFDLRQSFIMATQREDDQPSMNRADRELSSQGPKDETQHYKTPEGRHVSVLLDISEELFMKELEPFDYHCHSKCEDTVCGWVRASPLSCIFTTQKIYKKAKQKEADSLPPVDSTTPNEESLPSPADSQPKSHARLHNSKKTQPLNSQKQSWRQTAVADHQPHSSEFPDSNDMQKDTAHFSPRDQIDKETPRETPLQSYYQSPKFSLAESKPTKVLKQNHKPGTIIPIKNITFLPSIKSLQLNPKISYHDSRSQAAKNGKTLEKNVSIFDKKCRKKGTRVDKAFKSEPAKAISTSKCQTCQYKHHLSSAPSGTFPMMYGIPLSFKADTVNPLKFSMHKNFHKKWLQPMSISAACSSEQQDRVVSTSLMPVKYSVH